MAETRTWPPTILKLGPATTLEQAATSFAGPTFFKWTQYVAFKRSLYAVSASLSVLCKAERGLYPRCPEHTVFGISLGVLGFHHSLQEPVRSALLPFSLSACLNSLWTSVSQHQPALVDFPALEVGIGCSFWIPLPLGSHTAPLPTPSQMSLSPGSSP